jgi:phage major head subunit gpT-like protein
MIINDDNIAFLNTSYRASYQRAFKGVTPLWPRFSTTVPSATKTNLYAWMGQFPSFREWLGDRQVLSVKANGYSIDNVPYESTVGVPRDDIEDDQWGGFGALMEEMGLSAAQFPDIQLFNLLNDGFAQLCYDGQPFFDADHPVGIPGQNAIQSVSNLQAGSGPAWFLVDIGHALKPLIWQWRKQPEFITKIDPRTSDSVFMKKEFLYGVDCRAGAGFGFWQMAYASQQPVTGPNVQAAYTAMTQFQSDQGRILGVNPTVMLCGPSTYFAARELIEAPYISATYNAGLYKLVEVVKVPWLS